MLAVLGEFLRRGLASDGWDGRRRSAAIPRTECAEYAPAES